MYGMNNGGERNELHQNYFINSKHIHHKKRTNYLNYWFIYDCSDDVIKIITSKQEI